MTKPFTWSYSRLKNFENCALKANEVDNLKHFKDESTEMLWGNQVHAGLAAAVERSTPEKFLASKRVSKWIEGTPPLDATRTTLFVEQKYGLTRDLAATYFDDWKHPGCAPAWYRGICDLAALSPPFCVAIDYKTGKVHHDGVQLFLMAACIMAKHADIDEVHTRFVWLKHDSVSDDTYKRSQLRDLWAPVLDRVKRMEQAYLTNNFPPTPSGLCRRHCPVVTCSFNGKFNNSAARAAKWNQ